MKIAVYGNRVNIEAIKYIEEVFNFFAVNKVSYSIHSSFKQQLLKNNVQLIANSYEYTLCDDIAKDFNAVIAIGGDGTFLETVTLVRNTGLPILGINTGRLGFLSSVSKENIFQALQLLLQKKYSLESRDLIAVQTTNKLFGDLNYALNEVTLHKKDSSAMVQVHAYVNDEYLNSYFADGLIVSTATGSTAYSLSCGGPILVPDSQAFVIVPIASHNLNVRPIIVSNKCTIKLKIEGRSKNYLLSLDSRTEVINASEEITLSTEKFKINLIKLEGQTFFNTIRNKLLWGIDKRNFE